MRLDIWGYVAPRIAEAPWIGHGIDASRTITAVGQMGDLTFPQVPLHPHSAPLQVWYELGAVGAGLLAALLAAGGLMAGQALATQAGAAAAACGAVAALAVLWSISYGAWQEWVLAVCGIALALANAARR
jgi:O-antigen ligase